MFLCAKFASHVGYSEICFHTVDTDVFVLAMYFQMTITSARFFIVLRASGRKKVLVISDSTLPKEMAEAVPGLYALTGCDSTSAFHGKGKSKAFALALKDPAYLNALKALGEGITVSTSVETFVSELHGVKNSSDINDARYEKFCTKGAMPEPHQLPPT